MVPGTARRWDSVFYWFQSVLLQRVEPVRDVTLSWVKYIYVRDAGCIAALELSTKADKQPSDAPSCDKVMLCGNLRSGISTRTVPWCRSHCDAVTPVILSCSVNSPHWPGLAWWELPVYLHTQCPSCWPRLPIQHPSIGKKFQTR